MSVENFSPLSHEIVHRKVIVASLEGKVVVDKDRKDEILPEDDRKWLKEQLKKVGVDLTPFIDGKVSFPGRKYEEEGKDFYDEKDAWFHGEIKPQTDFVYMSLGREKFLRMVAQSVVYAAGQSGGRLIEKEDREKGVEEPSQADVAEFIDNHFKARAEKKAGFVYSPQTTAENDEVAWHKNALYRAEAVISVAYTMLAMTAKDGEASDKFQKGSRVEKFLRQRLVRGQKRALKAQLKEVPQYLSKKENDEKFIRHLPPGTLNVIMGEILQ